MTLGADNTVVVRCVAPTGGGGGGGETPCTDPEPSTLATAQALGSLVGDASGQPVAFFGSICPRDQDWFRFRLVESDSSFITPRDLRARVTLTPAASGGDLDLCVRNAAGAVASCSSVPGTVTEAIDLVVGDTLAVDTLDRLLIEVRGAGAAATNSYTLRIVTTG